MYILCDTCSILMLIRIAPKMFIDEQYECSTIREVYDEMFIKQKRFKDKYPWRTQYKNDIKYLNQSEYKTDKFYKNKDIINHLILNGTIRERTGRCFDPSFTDQIISAFAITHDLRVATCDKELIDFLSEQFERTTISSLGLINKWIQKGLIEWNDNFQQILREWKRDEEASQPNSEKAFFKELTGYSYEGP